MGACFDDDGVTVRKLLRTYRLGWHEVSRFEDESINSNGVEGIPVWALDVALHDGQVICVPVDRLGPRPETLAVIRQAAARHGVPAEHAGEMPG